MDFVVKDVGVGSGFVEIVVGIGVVMSMICVVRGNCIVFIVWC